MTMQENVKLSLENGDLLGITKYARDYLEEIKATIENCLYECQDDQVIYRCMLIISYCKKVYNTRFSVFVEECYKSFLELFGFST